VLRDRLAVELDRRGPDPFRGDTVVVPSASMARWLSLELARSHGVVANVRFVLPAQFVWDVFAGVLGDRVPTDLFDPAVLAWRIFDELGRLGPDPRFATIAAYTAGASDRSKVQIPARPTASAALGVATCAKARSHAVRLNAAAPAAVPSPGRQRADRPASAGPR
jgi:exonuclease V gamma subunit